MPNDPHDTVAAQIARTRFPFPGQTTWPADYVTLVNVPAPQRGISTPQGEHFPDILIVDGSGRAREVGEVEMTVSPAIVPHLRASSDAADNDTATGVKHFFLYVPAGLEDAAQTLLEANAISYAGLRAFSLGADGAIRVTPVVTPGDPYDHQ